MTRHFKIGNHYYHWRYGYDLVVHRVCPTCGFDKEVASFRDEDDCIEWIKSKNKVTWKGHGGNHDK